MRAFWLEIDGITVSAYGGLLSGAELILYGHFSWPSARGTHGCVHDALCSVDRYVAYRGSKDDPGRTKKGGKAKPLSAKASMNFLFFGL